ncbi:hypothetical protein EVAR_46782_1 [Eumeta japonica]|uniref:Uncharacterized protein n=1 Tax=Eumeta variegata TaxID=151549 RepID=A0A4C1XB72_EUMVA|nr:hypothetical protein EVAR_46782_1 [Eumeta japonica]
MRTGAVTSRTPVDELSLLSPRIMRSLSSRLLSNPSPSQHHFPVLLKLGFFTGEEQPIEIKTLIDWKRVSTALEEVDTPNLNFILDDIVPNNNIDITIGALTKHIRSVVKRYQRKVPANSDRWGLPADVRELIRAKNAPLHRASAYPTPEYRSRARKIIMLLL